MKTYIKFLINLFNISFIKVFILPQDAYGNHGPHVRWNQEEVYTRRRKNHLVSF